MTHSWCTYNAGSAPDARLHADLLKILETAPLVLGLNEVGDRAKVLARFTARVRGRVALTPRQRLSDVAVSVGYRLVQIDDGPGSMKIAALVSPTVDMGRPYIVKLTGRTKVGRRTAGARRTGYTAAKYLLAIPYKIDGHKQVYGVVHFVPSAMKRGNTATRELHGKQVEAAADWLRRRKRTAILAGDLNAATNRPRERKLLAALAKVAPLRSVPSHGKRAIDVFATDLKGSVRAIDGLSSDHRAVVFTSR